MAEIYAANVVAAGPICPKCNGDGLIPIVDGYAEDFTDCEFCSGAGWLAPTDVDDVDDVDHAEYVDPIDHTHDAPIGVVALQQRLQAVLDIHRATGEHTCAAEQHALYPCPTARAALGMTA